MDTKKATGLNLSTEEHEEVTRCIAFFAPTGSRGYVNELFEFLVLQALSSHKIGGEQTSLTYAWPQIYASSSLISQNAPTTEPLSFDSLSDLPPVQADAGLLGQMLSIMLTTAFNYTAIGGRVKVYTKTQVYDGKYWACLSVRDTVPGIVPEEEHLFERSFRGKIG